MAGDWGSRFERVLEYLECGLPDDSFAFHGMDMDMETDMDMDMGYGYEDGIGNG